VLILYKSPKEQQLMEKIVKMLLAKKRATAGKHRSSRRGEEKSSRSSRTSPNKSVVACQKTAALVYKPS